MNITRVFPADDTVLYIEIGDGRAGLLDVSPYLNSEAFEPLKDHHQFSQVRNGGYFIEWACGADLSLDTILARWKPVREDVSLSSMSIDNENAYDVESIRREHHHAYKPWNERDDANLRKRYLAGAKIDELVTEFGRQPGGIRSRLRKLGLDA